MKLNLSDYTPQTIALMDTLGYRSLMRLPQAIMFKSASDGWVDVVKVDTEVMYRWEGYVVVGVRRRVG